MKAIYETLTGNLRSLGTVIADPLPEGLAVKDIGETHKNGIWNPSTLVFDPVAPAKIISRAEFRKRFTLAERQDIDDAPNNGAFTANQRRRIRTWLADLQAAQDIDLNDADIISGVQAFESIGLIANGRAAQVLA